jgi:hypothetical protein
MATALMSPRTSLLLLTAVLAAAGAARPSTAPPASATLREAGAPARALDAGTTRAAPPRPQIPSVQPPGRGLIEVKAVDDAAEPSTRILDQDAAGPESGMQRKNKAHADRTDGQPDPYIEALLEQSRAQAEALLEQSRAQTEALHQIAAQQRVSEEARIAAQHAQTQRAVQLNGARIAIDGTLQSLQAMGDWNADSLESTRASLRQTAAAASAAGSPVEASRAAEAARYVEAAQAALAQRNAQQAQYYLLEANQLLFGAPDARY